MLLTISTTHRPATDLGYLLHKNPGRFQSFTLPFGRADVFYPEADADRCTAALLLDIDPVGLVRPKSGMSNSGGWLQQYVNDRPYVASSHLSVAIASVFSSALAGNYRDRPELAQQPIPLEAQLPTLPSREGRNSSSGCSSHWATPLKSRNTRWMRTSPSGEPVPASEWASRGW